MQRAQAAGDAAGDVRPCQYMAIANANANKKAKPTILAMAACASWSISAPCTCRVGGDAVERRGQERLRDRLGHHRAEKPIAGETVPIAKTISGTYMRALSCACSCTCWSRGLPMKVSHQTRIM